MKRFLFSRLFVVLLGFLIATSHQAQAEMRSSFFLDSYVHNSPHIVAGNFDATGTFTVETVFKGFIPQGSILHFDDGQKFFASLPATALTGNVLRAVAFLEPVSPSLAQPYKTAQWHLQGGWTGLVGLTPERVYYFGSQSYYDESDPRYIPFNGTTFLEALPPIVRAMAQLDELLKRPSSARRMKALLAFLDQHLETNSYYWDCVSGLFYSKLTLRSDEQQVILDTLHATSRRKEPSSPRKQAHLLNLLGYSAKSPRGFELVATFIQRSHPTPVREHALWCLARLDKHRAVPLFLPLMTLDDPALEKMVGLLIPETYFHQNALVNREAAQALVRVSAQVRQLPLAQRPSWSQLPAVIVGELEAFGQPAQLEELHEWAIGDDTYRSGTAWRALSTLTGLDFEHNPALWDQWWPQGQPLFRPNYDLTAAQGRESWFRAFNAADPATRRILLRLWYFETNPNEAALLQTASTSKTSAEAAKAVLSHLWECQRLSPATREAIVVRFLDLKLVQLDQSSVQKGWSSVRIIGTRNFPFPPHCWVEDGSSTVVGNEKHDKKLRYGGFDLQGTGPLTLGGRIGSLQGKPPIAHAILELRQKDYSSTAKARVLAWKHRWTLPPLALKPNPESKANPA